MSGDMWMPTAPPTLAALLAVHLQPVPVLPALAVALLVAYVVGVLRLRRRGDRWPISRTAWWCAGAVSILAVTATGLDGYGMELFSVHMVQHMVLGMLTPVLLALGAPMTLLLRALPSRSWARRTVLAVVHSRPAAVLTNPFVVSLIFFGSLYGLYFTPLFDALMSTMWGHNLMLAHFVAVGMLYFWSILGVDPSPRPPGSGRVVPKPVVSLLELISGVPVHAFFGVAVMTMTTLLGAFYAHPDPMWRISPIVDQQTAGGIAWGFTELPTLLVLGVLFVHWQASDAKRAARAERAQGRRDAELEAYNAYLAELSSRG